MQDACPYLITGISTSARASVMRLEIKSEDGVIDLGVQENKIVQAVAAK